MSRRSLATALVGIGALAIAGLALSAWVDPLVTDGGSTGAVATAGHVLLALAGVGVAIILLRVDPAWALSFGVAAAIFNGNWDLAGSPVPFDRLLIGLGVLALLLRARRVEDVLGGAPRPVHWMLLLVSVYALFSAVFSGTLDSQTARYGLVDQLGFVPFVLFAIGPAVYNDERRRRILLGTLTVVGAYLAYTSILGHLGPRSLVFPNYIVDPSVGIHADRARGPFVAAAGDGLALFECAVAAVLLAVTAGERWVRRSGIAVALACGLSIELTLTRSVWIASAAGLLVALLATRQTRRYLVPVVAAAVIAVFGALAVIPGFQSEAENRVNDDKPVWDRQNINGAALRMIEARPLLGFGWGTFQRNNAGYQRLAADHPITRADLDEHNVFLARAVELGLPTTAVWILALVLAVGSACLSKRGPPDLFGWRVGLVAIAAQWLVVANTVPLAFAFPNALLWLWAGIAFGPRQAAVTARETAPGTPPAPAPAPMRPQPAV
ncbi:MAG: putative inorganic carbon ((-)) transporter [Solirubrobacterales bacterium]|jgi:O-antigen ligase|nr:putative inorganic carbon ((-)) transporter [Solirubrobacterales bacterium]